MSRFPALPRFDRHEGVSGDIECTSILFSARAAEGIEWCAHLDIGEADLFEHRCPAFTRKATGNSGRPEIYVSYRGFGNRFAVGDVTELKSTAGS